MSCACFSLAAGPWHDLVDLWTLRLSVGTKCWRICKWQQNGNRKGGRKSKKPAAPQALLQGPHHPPLLTGRKAERGQGLPPALEGGCARPSQAHMLRRKGRSSLMALAGEEDGSEDEMLSSVPCCDST